MNLKEIDIKTVKIEVKMHNVFFRFLLFFEKVKFSTKKTKTLQVYFAKNVLQYFRFFVKGFAKMSMTKQNLGFPLDFQNRMEG